MIWIGKQIGILTARATHHRVSEGTGSTDGACVIDGNIEATETSNGPVDDVFDFVFVAHSGYQMRHEYRYNVGAPPCRSRVRLGCDR